MPEIKGYEVFRVDRSPNLWLLPVLGGGKEKQLTHFEGGNILSVSCSADGKWIALVRGPNESNAVLFRAGK